MQNEKLLKWIIEKNMNDIYQCSYCKYIKKLRAWEMKKVKVFWKVLKKSCHQQKLMWIRSSFKTWILLRSFGFFCQRKFLYVPLNTRMFVSLSKEPFSYVKHQQPHSSFLAWGANSLECKEFQPAWRNIWSLTKKIILCWADKKG